MYFEVFCLGAPVGALLSSTKFYAWDTIFCYFAFVDCLSVAQDGVKAGFEEALLADNITVEVTIESVTSATTRIRGRRNLQVL